MILHDAVIPFHEKDKPTVEKCCEALKNVLKIERIFLVTKENPNIKNTIFINELEINNLITLKEISDIWKKSNSKYSYRSGWIYQQILKLAASEYIKDLNDNFLICDSDVIFLKNPYEQIEENKFPYAKAYSGEYHEPYRKNYWRLMKEHPESGYSFINHHMIYNKNYVEKLKEEIEEKQTKRWDLAIVDVLDLDSFSDFSEYDLYGNWMFKNHKNKLVELNFKIKDINKIPTTDDINKYCMENYDILSCQAWAR